MAGEDGLLGAVADDAAGTAACAGAEECRASWAFELEKRPTMAERAPTGMRKVILTERAPVWMSAGASDLEDCCIEPCAPG